MFARDPDSLVIFTQHEEERAFAVELVVRNLPPVEPFVVEWQYPWTPSTSSFLGHNCPTASAQTRCAPS